MLSEWIPLRFGDVAEEVRRRLRSVCAGLGCAALSRLHLARSLMAISLVCPKSPGEREYNSHGIRMTRKSFRFQHRLI
jgi:hypothetical protein